MGFLKSISKGFKKIGKGIKKHFKSIGKGIKSAMGKIGKFMGKIGWVGQLALMFTPVGAMMSGMLGSIGNVAGSMFGKVVGQAAVQGVAGSGAGLLGSSSAILRGAGTVLKAAGNFAQAGHSAFRTITDGISSFVGEFSKTALKKIPGMENVMPKYLGSGSDTFFGGENSAWSKVTSKVSSDAAAILDSFNEDIGGVSKVLTQPQADLKAKAQAQVNKTATGVDSVGPMKEGYKFPDATKSLDVNVSGLPDVTKATESLGGGIPAAKDSLLSQVTDYGSNLYDNAVTAVQEIPGKILEAPGKFVDDIGKRVVGGIETKAMQAIGLEDKPVYETTQYNAYVPEFTMAPAGQYASADINDRAMQIQVSGQNHYQQNPYGYGAAQYLQQMARATGGAA